MKVLLVNSISYYVKQKAAIPLGLLSLATYLTQNGHTVRIYDRTVEGGSISKQISTFVPDIVGVSSLGIKSFDDAMKVSRAAQKKDIPVVWGGQIPTLIPELVLKSGLVDYVVMSDGEITFLALLEAIENNKSSSTVDGIAYFENGAVMMNREREDAQLSQLPVIDFRFVNPEKYYVKNMGYEKMLHIYSSKGCTGRCTYCYCPGYSKCKWRARPVEYCIKELEYLVEHHDIDGFYFVDDLFAPNKERVFEVCDKLIESNLGLVWSCDMRIDICTEDILQKMYDAGCRWIFTGIESGSPERQKSIKKRLGTEKIEKTIGLCKKIGIWTTASFVIGFPDETQEELKQTLDIIDRVHSDVKIVALYGPMPKSEMYNDLVKSHRLSEPASYTEWEELAIIDKIGNNYSKIPARELKVIANFFLLSIIAGGKTDKETKQASTVWSKRLIGLVFDIMKRGNIRAVYILFLSAKEFFEMIFYATMFPKIRKKYGLTFRLKNRI